MAWLGRWVSWSAAAAGPISNAVDRIAPMLTADNATASDSARRYRPPTSRTGMPRDAASSGLIELSSRGR